MQDKYCHRVSLELKGVINNLKDISESQKNILHPTVPKCSEMCSFPYTERVLAHCAISLSNSKMLVSRNENKTNKNKTRQIISTSNAFHILGKDNYM